jgi:formylglycine-generating enzyme required for sulfatase activity
LLKYTWFFENSENHAWPVGLQKPNDYGLFDMLGNVFEWCDNSIETHAVADASVSEDSGTKTDVRDKIGRVLRSGGFNDRPANLRSAFRINNLPTYRLSVYGFRPARTYP